MAIARSAIGSLLISLLLPTQAIALQCTSPDVVAGSPELLRHVLSNDVVAHGRIVGIGEGRIRVEAVEAFRGAGGMVELATGRVTTSSYAVGDVGVYVASAGRLHACSKLEASPKLLEELRRDVSSTR